MYSGHIGGFMAKLTINLNPDFEDSLYRLMQRRGIRTKSEAVRVAVQEGLERSLEETPKTDFSSWIGLACGKGENPQPRFVNADDDALWGEPG